MAIKCLFYLAFLYLRTHIHLIKVTMALKRLLKIGGYLVASLLGIFVIVLVLLNTEAVKSRILKRANELLTEQLGTQVKIGDVDISLLHQSIRFSDVALDDKEQRPMLKIERLGVELKLLQLIQNQIVIEEAELSGVEALLLKPSKEEPANFQFLIDAFSKKKEADSTMPKEPKKKVDLEIDHVLLNNIHLHYNDYDARLQKAEFDIGWLGNPTLSIEHIEALWTSHPKKGPMNNRAHVDQLTTRLRRGNYDVTVNGLNFKTDNGLPRKNAGKPKKGYFDTGHFDLTANLHVLIDSIANDTLKAHLLECTATDSVMGIDIRDLHSQIFTNFTKVNLKETTLQQKNTVLHIPEAEMTLPSKKEERPLSYTTGTITGHTQLQDIAHTFAPVLGNFSYPLNLSVKVSGNNKHISFRDIVVTSDDQKLRVNAIGSIDHLGKKEDVILHFNINQMSVARGIPARIIDQFTVKKLMMKQLDALGNIGYTGNLTIPYKHVNFDGTLRTVAGSIDVLLGLDSMDKYVTGQVETKGFDLGQVMDIDGLKDIVCSADFKVDISKPRTAEIRKAKGGKLPIGTVNAKIEDSSFMGIHIRNLTSTIESDGSEALGDIYQQGKHRDLYFSFSFTDTDDMKKMKIRNPGIRFHEMSEADKEAETQRKQQRAEERAAKKEERAIQREQKALERQQKREQAAKEKEQKRQENAAKEKEGPTS